jgi:hypothetical protein
VISADKKILVGSEIPGVSLGYDGTPEMKVVAGSKISWQSVEKDVYDESGVQLTQTVGRWPSATMKAQVILATGDAVSYVSRQRVRMTTTSSTNVCWPSTIRSMMESTGVTPGYDKSRQVKMKYAAVKLIVLDSQNDYDNVGESTGVDMHAHEVARHEMVSPINQEVGGSRIKCKIADFGQHGEGSMKLTAGEVEYADEATMHGWIPWRNSTVDGMMVRGLLKHESSCVGIKKHTSMCIASVEGECYDSARTRGESKMSRTEGVSPRFARSRYAGRYSCVNGTTIPQQLLEMAKERGLALVQTEERHSSATDQVRVEDNKHRVGNDGQVVIILDWMVPGICSRCVAMRFDLQGIHEDCGGMVISSGMGQKCVNPEAASKTYDSKVVHESVKIMDKVMKWLRTQDDKDGSGAMKFCASNHHEYLVTTPRGGMERKSSDGLFKYWPRPISSTSGKDDGRLMCYVNAPYVMQMNMVRYAGVELTMNEFPAVVWGKRKLNTKSLTESELIGVINMMSIMLWIRNFLLKQEERIEVDLLLGNKSPSPEEQGGKTPSLKRAMYVNVRLVNITMGNKCSVNPMVCK